MNYIVLDMEWNQPYTKEQMVKKPVALVGEIVQIGAVKLDKNFSTLDTFDIIISPQYYKKMHKGVSKLTGITNDILKKGSPFDEAFDHFKDWCGEDFSILTWGGDDVPMLKTNMSLYQMDTRWIPNFYNVQAIFDNQITKSNKPLSLSSAMEVFGEPALDAHNALNDAKNTAKVLSHLDMQKGLKDYPNLRNQLIYLGEDVIERSEYTRSFDTVVELFKDSEVITFDCPQCGKSLCCKEFVKQNSDKYMSLCCCDCGKEFLIRYKLSKKINGRSAVTRLVYQATQDKIELFKKKQEEIQKQKVLTKPFAEKELFKLVTKRKYTSRPQAYNDRQIKNFKCPLCGTTVTCKQFDAHSSGIRTTTAICRCGAEYPVKLKFSPKIHGKMKLTRIVYTPLKTPQKTKSPQPMMAN